MAVVRGGRKGRKERNGLGKCQFCGWKVQWAHIVSIFLHRRSIYSPAIIDSVVLVYNQLMRWRVYIAWLCELVSS